MKNIIKNKIIPFVLGALIFSSITYVVAANIPSTSVTYTTSANSTVTNVKQAVDDLYLKTSNTYTYYMPATGNNGIPGDSYSSPSALRTYLNSLGGYAPYFPYIRATVKNGVPFYEACASNSSGTQQFCLPQNYYVGNGTTAEPQAVASRMANDIEAVLGAAPSCSNGRYYAYCSFSFGTNYAYSWYAIYDGSVVAMNNRQYCGACKASTNANFCDNSISI